MKYITYTICFLMKVADNEEKVAELNKHFIKKIRPKPGKESVKICQTLCFIYDKVSSHQPNK